MCRILTAFIGWIWSGGKYSSNGGVGQGYSQHVLVMLKTALPEPKQGQRINRNLLVGRGDFSLF